MSGFLAHLFIPLTAAYILFPDMFRRPRYLLLAGFGLLPDFDKLLAMPGLLHSLLTLGPLCLIVLVLERVCRSEYRYGPLIIGFVLSHLVLDFLNGGPVPLAFPLVETGIGLEYPVRTVFGRGPFGLPWLEGSIVHIRTVAPVPSNRTYGFITGLGVANAILFVIIYVGRSGLSTRLE